MPSLCASCETFSLDRPVVSSSEKKPEWLKKKNHVKEFIKTNTSFKARCPADADQDLGALVKVVNIVIHIHDPIQDPKYPQRRADPAPNDHYFRAMVVCLLVVVRVAMGPSPCSGTVVVFSGIVPAQ